MGAAARRALSTLLAGMPWRRRPATDAYPCCRAMVRATATVLAASGLHVSARANMPRCAAITLQFSGAGVSPILESPEAAASGEKEGHSAADGPNQRSAASPQDELVSADAAEAGTAVLPPAAAALVEEAVNELAAGQLAALFAAESPAPAVPLSTLQQLLALCGQVWRRPQKPLSTTLRGCACGVLKNGLFAQHEHCLATDTGLAPGRKQTLHESGR